MTAVKGLLYSKLLQHTIPALGNEHKNDSPNFHSGPLSWQEITPTRDDTSCNVNAKVTILTTTIHAQ